MKMFRATRCVIVTGLCLLPLARAAMGQAPPEGEGKGAITGHVMYADTRTPARAAQIMLVKLTSGTAPASEKSSGPASPSAGSLLDARLNALAQTGLDGRFAMADVPAGRYIVLVQQGGAVNPLAHLDMDTLNSLKIRGVREEEIKPALPYLTIVTVNSGKTVDATVSLNHGASISGVVTYDDGSPAVGAQVHLMSKTSNGSYEEPTMMTLGMASSNASLAGYVTDDGGHFRIAGLIPGTYAVRVTLQLNMLKNIGTKFRGIMMLGISSPDALASATKYDDGLSIYSGNVFSAKDLRPIKLGEGEAFTGADVTVPLEGMHPLDVHVEDSATGTSISLGQVKLLDADGKETLRECFLDDQGNGMFEYVPDGRYTLEVANALDVSAAGKLGSKNYDPAKAVHYGLAKTTVQVSGDTAKVTLQVARASTGNSAAQ